MSTKEEIKRKENIAVNEPEFNEKNTTKFNKDINNFNERTKKGYNDILNQQLDIINKILDNTLHSIKKSTDEATREIPRYAQRIAEYQEQTIQSIKGIASDFIEAEKEVVNSFQSHQVDPNNSDVNSSSLHGLWDLYNPQKIVENHAVMVKNFTSYLLNTSNIINNALASNMGIYNTALKQTRDNLKACVNTYTEFAKASNSDSKEVNTSP